MKIKDVTTIIAKKTLKKDVILDPNGFFVIEISNNQIRVEYYKNVYRDRKIVSGDLTYVFIGLKAEELCDTISKYIKNLRNEHYMYLGRELIKAENALINDKKYIQGGC